MPSWSILVVILLPIAAALAIVALERLRPNFGLAWLIATLASIGDWALLLVLRLRAPAPLQVADWLPFLVNLDDRLLLQVDAITWPLAFSMATLLLAVTLTAPVRLNQQSFPSIWASNLFVTGMGLMGVLAGNLISLLLVWSLIDLVELVVMLRTAHEPRLNRQVVAAFAVRVSGTIIALSALVLEQGSGSTGQFGIIPAANILLLVAAGLRLGVLPLNLPYQQEVQMRRGVGTLIRMVSAATSLVLLARLSATELPAGWTSLLLFCTAVATLYAAGMWAGAPDPLNGRPYWVVAIAGLAISCVIGRNPLSSLTWSTAMILSGGVLSLYSARARYSIILPVLAALAFSGLPFTPTAYGWTGLLGASFTFFDLVMILAVALLILGLIRHALTPGDSLQEMQGWIRVAYPLGLILLVASGWLISLFGPEEFLAVGRWPASVAATLLAGLMVAIVTHRQRLIRPERRPAWPETILHKVAGWLASFFNFRWLYALLAELAVLLRRLVEGFSLILEGEGGVLWALVLLALLLTLINPGIGR